MTSEEYAKQQISMGMDVHCNDGVWWLKVRPFFFQPANPWQVIEPDKAKPKFIKSFLGYSHLVSEVKYANKSRPKLVLGREKLENFGIQSLSSKRRSTVRKGLKLNQVKKIDCIDTYINDIQSISISTAARTKHGKPAHYYTKEYEKWKQFIVKLSKLTTGEWWGAFFDNKLIAYVYTFHVDDVVTISAAKSHSDYLDKCPNDALIFTIVDYCKNLPNCRKIDYGDWSTNNPNLNDFKQRFGFEKVDLPIYLNLNPMVKVAINIKNVFRPNTL